MLYEVTLSATYFGQLCINRWNYLSSGVAVGIVPSVALITAMGWISEDPTFLEPSLAVRLQDLQSNALTYNSVQCRALYDDPADFYDYPFPTGIVGNNNTSQGASPVVALGFRTTRVRTDIGRGTKRFSGMTEALIDAGGDIASTAISAVDTLADEMSAVLPYTAGGSSLSFTPVVLGKLEYETPRGNRAYKQYPTLSEQLDHIAQGFTWDAYPQVRSQVSRQYGRGS
jgi:hypothetical protein